MSSDGRHCFHLEFIRYAQFFACPFVVESFHPMQHQTLLKALQREILPRRSGIVGVRDRWFVIVIEGLSRNEHDEHRSVFRPRLVRIGE